LFTISRYFTLFAGQSKQDELGGEQLEGEKPWQSIMCYRNKGIVTLDVKRWSPNWSIAERQGKVTTGKGISMQL